MRLRTGLVLLAIAAAGCSREDRPAPPAPPAERCSPLEREGPARPRSVVFILSDTTRRDRMGVYGGPARTPSFDAFAREGLLFTAATSQATWTKPSLATLFTGLLPAAHGVVSHPDLRDEKAPLESDVLSERFDTLAEALAAAGYQTAAFVSNPWLQRELGFAQGFETWEEGFADNATPGEVVTQAGLAWLAGRRGDPRPFFLYLHYMDAHAPYHRVPEAVVEARRAAIEADARPVPERARRFVARVARDATGHPLVARGLPANLALLETVYDVGVEHFDRALGGFLSGFARLPGAEDAAVIVTADHGEALFAHGWTSHGYGLFEDEAGIPLAARLPGVASRGPVACPVGLVDLRRTLCDYLGVPCPGEDQGTSLFSPALADPERVLLVESVIGRPRNRAVRGSSLKLLFEPDGRLHGGPVVDPFALYDLDADPTEQVDLLREAALDPATRAGLERLRAVATATAEGPRATAEKAPLDEETRRQLEALGYLDRPDSSPPPR